MSLDSEFTGEDEFPSFELLPADAEEFSPDEELAAVESLLDPTVIADPVDPDVPEPLGRTWVLDDETNQLATHGQQAMMTRGVGAVIEWCAISPRIARFAWSIFPDDVGMEEPDRLIGFIDEAERRAQYAADIRDTLPVHDRITEVKDFRLAVDADDPELMLMSAKIIVDDEAEADLEEIPLGLAVV